MAEVPSLTTERLHLQAPGLDGYRDSAAMWGDEAVARYIGGRPSTAEETWARLMRYVGHWELLGFGYWTVRERSSGRFVGEVGFADWRRELDPPFDGAPEAGWVLAPWAHGRGFASEAVAAMCAWGDKHFSGAETVCMIHPDNSASLRVAERAGFIAYAQAEYHGSPTVLLRRTTGKP